MFRSEWPRTLADAMRVRYGRHRNHYVRSGCAAEVYDSSRWYPHQCTRKNGHGPDRLYCKQHAKMVQEQEA